MRIFTAPLSAGAIERRAWRTIGPWVRRLWWVPTAIAVAGLAVVAWGAWGPRVPLLEPRHRAEALCFALAQTPAFAPPMTVEPGAALVRGRFARGTPPAIAVQQIMRYRDEMVARQWRRRVGDYDVSCSWLRIPEPGGASHWLVIGWMEDADLAMCSFRFGDGPALTSEEQAWGERLLARVLVPDNFRAGVIPNVRLRSEHGNTMPTFGPKRSS